MHEHEIEEGLISVVMSTYNRSSEYLRQSIESILSQTYTHFEFIIIDDGSDKGTKVLIESYNDPRIRLIVNKQNIGLTNSLNKALDECRGEYIARMDDDDIALPERFEKQVAFMRKNPDVIVCGTWVANIDENGELTGTTKKHCIDDMDSYRIYLLFGNTPTIVHPSAFFNHRLFMKYNIHYCPTHRYAQDYGLWVRCSAFGKCAILPEILMKYRVHSHSISVEKIQMQKEIDYAIIQEQLDALHLTLPDELKADHHRILTNYCRIEERCTPSMKKWLKAIIKANGRYKIYNQKKLKKMIWNRWRIICQIASIQQTGFTNRISIMLSITPRGFLYGMETVANKMMNKIVSH